MPSEQYRAMADEDLASIVVYIRSLPPIRNSLPKTEIIFPVKYLIRNAPQPLAAPVPPPDLSSPLKRGEYLVRMAGCTTCHTPQECGQSSAAMGFAGGLPFNGPRPTVTGANITPDLSGIPDYDENLSLLVMRTGKVRARDLSAVMPFVAYRNTTDEDLMAIYTYLRTIPPVHHRVDNSLRRHANFVRENTAQEIRTNRLAHFDQTVSSLPVRPQRYQSLADFHLRNFRVRSSHHRRCFSLGQLKQLPVANQIGHAEVRHPRLPRPEELSRPAQF